MATFTIVSKDKDPLGPGEINAGSTIDVSDGDVFVVDPSADEGITFAADGSGPAEFDIVFTQSNNNDFTVKVENDLTPNLTISDNVDLSGVDLNAQASDGVTYNAGNNVTFGQYEGSSTGVDIITIGDGFTATQNWDTKGGDDIITVGDDATFEDIQTGTGDDTLTFGDRATFHDIETKEGDDSVTFGDDMDGNKVKTGKDDDTIRVGANSNADEIDGGEDNDQYTTESEGANSKNMESTTVVCFVGGTMIDTLSGPVPVERLSPGAMIATADRGFQPLRWIGSVNLSEEELIQQPRVRPVRISAHALGPRLPARDIRVSPQHRILLRSSIVRRMYQSEEIFIAARHLKILPGVNVDLPRDDVTYYHLLLDRHEVIYAHGIECESLYLGQQARRMLGRAALDEINRLDPPVATRSDDQLLARPSPHRRVKLEQLLKRHMRNRKPLLCTRDVTGHALAG